MDSQDKYDICEQSGLIWYIWIVSFNMAYMGSHVRYMSTVSVNTVYLYSQG